MRGAMREILCSRRPFNTGSTLRLRSEQAEEHGVKRRSGYPGFRDIRSVLQRMLLTSSYLLL